MSEARFNRLEELKAEVAAALNLPVAATNVLLLSALKLEHELLIEALVAGRAVEPNALLNLTEAIARFIPAGPPLKVEVEIVDTLVGICPNCKTEVRPYTPPDRSPAPLTPSAPETHTDAAPMPGTRSSEAAPKRDNVVPLWSNQPP